MSKNFTSNTKVDSSNSTYYLQFFFLLKTHTHRHTESVILNSSGENVIENVRHVSFNLLDSSRQFTIPLPNGRKIQF